MQHATQAALLCASEHWCAFCFHANSLSSFIFLTSSSYASDELGLLQILLKCTHNLPLLATPLQRNKTKTLRSYKCKPVILLVSAPWLTNGTADGIFPLHFNLEYVPRSFHLLASIFCCCEPLLHAAQFISIMETVAERVALWVSNDLQLRWCQYPRGERKVGVFQGSKVQTWRGHRCPRRCIFSRSSSEFCLWTRSQLPGPGLCVSVMEIWYLAFEISMINMQTWLESELGWLPHFQLSFWARD